MRASAFVLKMAFAAAMFGLAASISPVMAGIIVEKRIVGDEMEMVSDDDAEQHLGYANTDVEGNPVLFGGMEGNSSSDLELGANRPPPDPDWPQPGNGPQLIGLRWRDIGIPAGATITNAYIQFTVNEEDKSPPDVPAALTISGELSPDPLPYNEDSTFNISSRPETTSKVMWNDIPVWGFIDLSQGGICVGCGDEGPNQRTPDLSPIIQEIVNQPGWSSGNALSLMVAPKTSNFNRTANSWESGDTNGPGNQGPLLHVEYVPEPSALALAATGLLALFARQRRR